MSLLRQLLFLLVLAGLGYAGFAGYQQWQQSRQQAASANGAPAAAQRGGGRATAVKTVKAGERTLLRIVEAVGSARAAQTVDIKPQADGIITEIAYTAGKRVEKGTVLFRLDDDIQKADLAQAKAELVKAQQALERGQSLRQSRVMAAASLRSSRPPAPRPRPRLNAPNGVWPTVPSVRRLTARPASTPWTWAPRLKTAPFWPASTTCPQCWSNSRFLRNISPSHGRA
jgi:hypothetical protein